MIQNSQIRKPHLVLIVDDQELNRDILGAILEDDYELLYAENGKEALELMRAHADTLSIVLLDLMMPVLDGFAVLETAKQEDALKNIPIIVLTAEKSAELRALQMGAADFITKPFDVTEIILARVSRIIELSEGRQLISAAERDKLTGLYNRNFFLEYADRLRLYHNGSTYDAVAVNIEQFHSINALHGREFGDAALRCIGDAIRSFLSETEGIASRLEADRFGIYCPPQPDYRALLARFQEAVDAISSRVNVHLRMGVKPAQAGVEPITLFDEARAACSQARGDYQNPIRIYDEEMEARELLNQRLLNDLQTAVETEQFQVFYQPKYDIQSEPPRLASAEALVRWKHPELGLVAPNAFIPLFESSGLIGIVDSFVWKEAAHQVAVWREKYGLTLPVSVNLSRADLFDPTLVDQLKGVIRENGLDSKNLKLEVTESAYIDNATSVLDIIRDLREQGFEIEMDDFGSGYSSLNMLSDMPIDVLKMDMKFIRHLETSETDRRLVSLVLDIAKYLGVKVVAEGVETEGQVALLQKGHCNLVQGYFFSRPLPPEDFEKLIERELEIERGEQL